MNARHRSIWGTTALAVTAISVIAFVILIVGGLAGVEALQEGEDVSVVGDVVWMTFAIGAILALVTGLIAMVLGRRGPRPADQRTGQLAVGWFVIAVLAVVLISALD